MVEKKAKKTLADLIALGDERAELIDGEIVMMSPVQASHSNILVEISGRLYQYFKDTMETRPKGPHGWWILSEAWTYYNVSQSFCHDLAGFRIGKPPGHPEKGPIRVKPEWVCEILSPNNWRNDAEKKRRVLEEYKVPYYWLVDPQNKGIMVFALSETGKYEPILAVSAGEDAVEIPPFLGLAINMTEIFATSKV